MLGTTFWCNMHDSSSARLQPLAPSVNTRRMEVVRQVFEIYAREAIVDKIARLREV
jgi:hypothetical protein